jgi:hypothetical protein
MTEPAAAALASDQQTIEIVRWAISIGVPAVSGLAGVVIGAWLTGRREWRQRGLAFIEKQLQGFYSPMLGLRTEIRMRSELRVRIHDAADAAWRQLCEEARNISVEALGQLSESRGPEFTKLIEYDNKQFQEELMPAYRQMVKLFRENLWLADPDTREHYNRLIEFVELWDRWLAKAIPAEVIEALEHSEERLRPFYDHLQQRHDVLRTRLGKRNT